MTEAELPTLQPHLFALGAAFRTQVDAALVQAFVIALDDLPLPRVLDAIRRAIREGGKFMPTPAEIRTMAGGITRPYHAEWRGPTYSPPPPSQRSEDWLAVTENLKPRSGT